MKKPKKSETNKWAVYLNGMVICKNVKEDCKCGHNIPHAKNEDTCKFTQCSRAGVKVKCCGFYIVLDKK